ncbi:MAG: hypothetical protein ACYC1M_19175 [Armatimonadota bacterium]
MRRFTATMFTTVMFMIWMLAGLFPQPVKAGQHDLFLNSTPNSITLGNELQRVTFARDASNRYMTSTSIRHGDRWEPFFGTSTPIVTGSSFNLIPSEAKVVRNTKVSKAVMLSGVHTNPDYNWDMLVETNSGTPMISFSITCHLHADMILPNPQPSVALWMTETKPEVVVDQGPESIYGSLGIPHNLGFPAAYLWHNGTEAMVYFDMTPATWMAADGIQRFFDLRVGTRTVEGRTGLGMHCDKLTGSRIRSGDMVVKFYLYSGARPERPTSLQALDTMVRVCAPLHPATSVFPRNYADGGRVSWTQFARKTINDLMVDGITYSHLKAPWTDGPLSLVEPSSEMVVHPGHISSASRIQNEWDFSTVNNHLSAWELYSRINPDQKQQELLQLKVDGLARFFDPKAGMIRWGTRQPEHVGDLEMSWQNLFFHIETIRAIDAAPAEDANPAVAGRFLISARHLIDYAHKVDYVFPQWFDPYKLMPVVQNDVPKLGMVREPWQVGSYAYVMMRAYRLSGDSLYRNEAGASIKNLLTAMRYTVKNEIYTREYTNPVEFPLTELFGNAYGAVAAYDVYKATGDNSYLRYSRDFANTLLRLTFWYEDETDPISRELRNAGLFYPHGGAHVATPWETTEANLCMTSLLKHDTANPIYSLLLKLTNLNRINSFYFYPAACSDTVLGNRQAGIGQYFPIEPFYSLEGNGGHRGNTAAYMSGMSMWNYWLYEALAEADDRNIMVLNLDALDGYDDAVSGASRHFVVFNPNSEKRKSKIMFKHLSAGKYKLETQELQGKAHAVVYTNAQLAAGIPVTMASQSHIRLGLTRVEPASKRITLQQQRQAGNQLSCMYACLQLAAMKTPDSTQLEPLQRKFSAAMKEYQSRNYKSVLKITGEISSVLH